MKKKIALLIAFITGILYVASQFIPHAPFAEIKEDFSVWFDVIAAFAFILGGGNLIFSNASKVQRKQKGWGYNLICLVSFFTMLIFGMFKFGNPNGIAGNITDPASWAGYIFDYFYAPLAMTMFSLLAFYIASASYRAFRGKE